MNHYLLENSRYPIMLPSHLLTKINMDATTILHQRWTMDITIADEEVSSVQKFTEITTVIASPASFEDVATSARRWKPEIYQAHAGTLKIQSSCSFYSTVTDLARLRGWSTSQPRRTAM